MLEALVIVLIAEFILQPTRVEAENKISPRAVHRAAVKKKMIRKKSVAAKRKPESLRGRAKSTEKVAEPTETAARIPG
jgi:hypothetical protein